jgi:hypothetical protein
MKIKQKHLTTAAFVAILFGLSTATAMAGPHSANRANNGGMNYGSSRGISAGHTANQQNQPRSTRIYGQHQTTRTNNQASHSYRTDTRVQANHAGSTSGIRTDYSHGRTNSTRTNNVRVQSSRGTVSGSSHSSHNRQQQRFGF